MPSGVYPRPSVEERLRLRLNPAVSGCLEWTGSVDSYGYGRISVNGKMVGTHKVAWELQHGPVPAGLMVLHHCDNRPCCNVGKCLFLGTSAVNTADMIAKGRRASVMAERTHCPRRHPYDEANTYVYPDGRRGCKACRVFRKSRAKVAVS